MSAAERRRDAGLATEADVLAVKVHLAQVRERQITAASRETVARLQLNELMGEPLDARFELQLPALTETTPPPADDLEAEALANRPDVVRAVAQERLALESITAAKSGFYPQAAVQGVYEFNGGTFADRASAWTVGAVLRWNLFGGFADSARLGEAKAAAERARAERQRQESAARVDVRSAAARLDEARARLEVGRLAVAQAAGKSPHRPRPLRRRTRPGQRSAPLRDGRPGRRLPPDVCRDRCSHERRATRAGAWKVTPS